MGESIRDVYYDHARQCRSQSKSFLNVKEKDDDDDEEKEKFGTDGQSRYLFIYDNIFDLLHKGCFVSGLGFRNKTYLSAHGHGRGERYRDGMVDKTGCDIPFMSLA